ncbi:histidinol-phosphate transaminase [Magnetococcus sp. PR-3]|uniref:histidinol-phosphate transaminase n=1 Tax=Magnetococcus sp. PR-3 TaxID=3120355 RepID=UPI002FCDF553
MSVQRWVRPEILAMAGYKPGEQPKPGERVIKLNTNENPYGPPEAVKAAMHAAINDDLRLYPTPDGYLVRQAAARTLGHGLTPEQIIIGNGSDDLLTMILRTFVGQNDVVAAMDPTYTLYEPLTIIQGGDYQQIPWLEQGALPMDDLVALKAKVIFVTRPNAPTGHLVPLEQVAQLCKATQQTGVVILDEAYGDFAEDHGLALLADHSNLIVTRSASKSLSLAGMRIGIGFMHPDVALQMHKVRDSYNVDRLAQVALWAAYENWEAYLPLIAQIKKRRDWTHQQLVERGFTITASHGNFVLAQVPKGELDGLQWLEALKKRGILIRYFGNDPNLTAFLRITIGTEEEMAILITAIDEIMKVA